MIGEQLFQLCVLSCDIIAACEGEGGVLYNQQKSYPFVNGSNTSYIVSSSTSVNVQRT